MNRMSSASLWGGLVFFLSMCGSARTGKVLLSESSSEKSLRLHLSTHAFSVRAFRFSALRVRDKIKFVGVDTVESSFPHNARDVER